MSSPTAARPQTHSSPHYYHAETGAPMHQIPTADGKRMKTPTLADARKLNLVPSVTTIIDAILRKPALEMWKTEQAVLACLTAPRDDGEAADAFVKRVLQDEQQQNQEARAAADLGTKLHDALESFFHEEEMDPALRPWVMPAAEAILKYGTLIATETVLIGEGYAGRTDLILDAPDCWWLFDYKTTKKVPDPDRGAWSEHRLQLSAYAKAYERMKAIETLAIEAPTGKPIRTANVYISTANEGKFSVCEHEPWEPTFEQGFVPLLVHWQWANKYWPGAPKLTKPVAPPSLIPPQLLPANIEAQLAASPGVIPPKKRKIAWAQGQVTAPQPTTPEAA